MDFVPNMTGTLIRVEEDENTRFHFEVWFDYTKRAMNLIREGAMLAVPNFACNDHEQCLSILEVVSILPMHYALGNSADGYPGFVVEAAKSAVSDWEEQEAESTEDTTKIRCIAIPTNLEVVQETRAANDVPSLRDESNLPMVGATAHLLDTSFTEYVANYGIRKEEHTLVAGTLIRDREVCIHARTEDLLRTHFGIFGFTGAGKSNLVSLLVHKLLSPCGMCEACKKRQPCPNRDPVKVVLFDLMAEYSTLLVEHLTGVPASMWVALGEETLPGSVVGYLSSPGEQQLSVAARHLCDTALLPRALHPHRGEFAPAFRILLEHCKVRIWRERQLTIGEFVERNREEVIKGNMGNAAAAVIGLVNRLASAYAATPFEGEAVRKVTQDIDHTTSTSDTRWTSTALQNIEQLKRLIGQQRQQVTQATPLPADAGITIPELIDVLNDPSCPGLYVIQSHDPDQLRHFAWTLGTFTFEARRKTGQITPLISFVFDEADEFIPQQARNSYAESSDIAMTLARRGRKFGLGIGIATQRVRYLNTSIMAQPHTYFVSKMPRFSDRQAVAEAFGVSEDMFTQTFKFKKGDWLLMSYDATGMEAIPVPIHCEDANDRVRSFLKSLSAEVPRRAPATA